MRMRMRMRMRVMMMMMMMMIMMIMMMMMMMMIMMMMMMMMMTMRRRGRRRGRGMRRISSMVTLRKCSQDMASWFIYSRVQELVARISKFRQQHVLMANGPSKVLALVS